MPVFLAALRTDTISSTQVISLLRSLRLGRGARALTLCIIRMTILDQFSAERLLCEVTAVEF